HQRLTGQTCPERKQRRAETFAPLEHSPRPDVEAEKGADHDAVARANSSRPHDARMRFPYPVPVIAADAEDGRPSRCSARAEHSCNAIRRNTGIAAEGRTLSLLGPEVLLLYDWKFRQILERLQRAW